MTSILAENENGMPDALGSPTTEDSAVVEHDHPVGDVRHERDALYSGPNSTYWNRCFIGTPTRVGRPLRRMGMKGDLVQLMGGGRS